MASISARRLRNDECTIESIDGDVRVGSYLETGILMMRTRTGQINIGKRLGIGKHGLISSRAGNFKVGSVFANMANLPKPIYSMLSLES